MNNKLKVFFKVVLGLFIFTALAAGGYYLTHKQEFAKLYTNSEFMSKYARYTQHARLVLSGDLNFKDTNINVFYVRQLVAEDNATQRTIMFSAKDKQDFSVEYKKKSVFGDSKTIKAKDVSFKDGKDSYIEYVVKLESKRQI